LYTSPSIIRLIRWAADVARMVKEPEKNNHSEDVGVHERMIIQWISG